MPHGLGLGGQFSVPDKPEPRAALPALRPPPKRRTAFEENPVGAIGHLL